MGAGPVTNPPQAQRPTWRLKGPHDKHTQGFVVSGFSGLPSAVALFLEFGWTGNGPGNAFAAGNTAGDAVEIPVVYDGPDLAEVAELTGLGVDEVVSALGGLGR